MGRLMIHNQRASGVVEKADQVKINEITGISSTNVQDALVEVSNGLISEEDKIKLNQIHHIALNATISGTSYTISNTNIKADSLIDVYYAEASKPILQRLDVTYTQSAGSLQIDFSESVSDIVLNAIKVVNI